MEHTQNPAPREPAPKQKSDVPQPGRGMDARQNADGSDPLGHGTNAHDGTPAGVSLDTTSKAQGQKQSHAHGPAKTT